MINLIPMVDFVLGQRKKEDTDNIRRFWGCERYANFLKQPLELWMFVACKLVDGAWVVLEEPDRDNNKYDVYDREFCYFNDGLFFHDEQEYQEAKDRVLFEGFEKDNYFVTHKSHASFFYPISCLHEQSIEDLVKYNLELTPTALKKIGL